MHIFESSIPILFFVEFKMGERERKRDLAFQERKAGGSGVVQ